MALSITSTLARAIFRAMIPSYIRMGFSMNAMILDARGYMPMYQRSTMLQDIRQFMGLMTGESRQAKLDPTHRITSSAVPSVDYGDRPAYRVYGTANFIHPITQEVRSTTVSFFTNLNYSPQAYETWMMGKISVEDYIPGWEVSGVDFRVVERNSRMT